MAQLIIISIVLFFCNLGLSSAQVPEPMPEECRNQTVSEIDVGNAVIRRYNGTWQRPVRNARRPVVVNLTLSLSSINDVLEKLKLIKVTAYLALRWFDEIHVWNETFPLNCVPYVVLAASGVWRPDVAQMNSHSKYALMDMPGEKIRLLSNGFTSFSPGGTFEAFCDFDFTMFPFDTQKCSIQLESWRYTREYVQFSLGSGSGIKIYQFSENDQWEFIGSGQALISEEYNSKEMQFDRVEFYIHIKRKAAYYLLNIVVPSAIISIAQISAFSLGARETVKLELSFTCLLAYSVFHLQVVGDMPRSSDRVPFLSIYLDLQMFYIAISMLGQGFVFLLLSQADDGYHDESRHDAPHWLFKIFKVIGRILHVKGAPDEQHFPALETEDEDKDIGNSDSLPEAKNTSSPLKPSVKFMLDSEEPSDFSAAPKRKSSVTAEAIANSTSCRLIKRRHRRSRVLLINSRRRWIYMAAVADRLTFVVYMACITITPIVVVIIARHSR